MKGMKRLSAIALAFATTLALSGMVSAADAPATTSTASAAKVGELKLDFPASIQVGSQQPSVIKIMANPMDKDIDSVALAGTYSSDVADIVITKSPTLSDKFNLSSANIDPVGKVFSVTVASFDEVLPKNAFTEVAQITVTPKKGGNFTLNLVTTGDQSTQMMERGTVNNILNTVTPPSAEILMVGDNSTVTTATAEPTAQTPQQAAMTNTATATSAPTTVPEAGAKENAMAGMIALIIGAGIFALKRRQA